MIAHPFETERLVMRATVAEDAVPLFESLSDPDFMHWWSRPPLSTLEEAREYIGGQKAPWRGWTVTIKDSGIVVGTVAAGEKRQGKVMEIGYMIARAHWGQGYAREAVAGLIEMLFAEGNRRVFADTDPDNQASRKLLEKLGFTLEGHLRGEWETHIGVRDSVIYGMLKEEWTNAHPRT